MEEYPEKNDDKIDSVIFEVKSADSNNPLICSVCDQYFRNPCLLSCYHSFCTQCLGGPHPEEKVFCPSCG